MASAADLRRRKSVFTFDGAVGINRLGLQRKELQFGGLIAAGTQGSIPGLAAERMKEPAIRRRLE